MNPIHYLLYRACVNPDAYAVFYQDKLITYGQLINGIRGGAKILRLIKSNNPSIIYMVDIRIADPLDYWIATLSCMHEGIGTMSPGPLMALPDSLHPRLVIQDSFQSTSEVQNHINWPTFDELSHSTHQVTYGAIEENQIARIFFTSGTTGNSKAIAFNFPQLAERSLIRASYLTNYSRALTMMPPYSSSAFQFSLMQWALGHALALDNNVTDVVRTLSRHSVKHLIASPNQLKILIRELKSLKTALNVNAVTVLGGVMTSRLFLELRSLTRAEIFTQYGATETGTCAVTRVLYESDLSQLGTCCPGVDAEVVDDQDDIVPPGTEGLLRIRTPHLAGGYLISDKSPQTSLRDGWFYPGDVAVANPESGAITLVGRVDDVANTGGSKINLTQIDDYLATQPGVQDAAAFCVFDNFDYPEIWAAVVVPKDFDLTRLLKTASEALGPHHCPKRILPVQLIPRTYSGKPQRGLMTDKVRALLGVNVRASSNHPLPQ